MSDSLVIPPRFCGPEGSGNGGYVCGRIAAYLDGPVTVTLRRPPPLATPMTVDRDGADSIRVLAGSMLIAEAAPSPDGLALQVPDPVSMTQARATAGRARYCADPLFPTCLSAGPAAGQATGCGSSPGRWQAGRCGRRRGHRTLARERQWDSAAGDDLGCARLPQRDRRRPGRVADRAASIEERRSGRLS